MLQREGEGIYRKEGGCYRGRGRGYIGKRVGVTEGGRGDI